MNEQKSNNLKVKTDIKAGRACPFPQDILNERKGNCEGNSSFDCKLLRQYKEDHPQCF
ncbi:MAG: hypothetical protein VSS75_007660 [Candidatus Parabeggiatoa sp.]|nr:hypothetical protein [Candidatus Parabeggiatoa sp.]